MHHPGHRASLPRPGGTAPEPGEQQARLVRERSGGRLECAGCGARLRFGRERGEAIARPADVAALLMAEMGPLEREQMRVVLLDARNHVTAIRTVYLGNVSAALVRVGELFRDAVREHAAGIVLVHNHPSGDPDPSPEDLHLTAEALAAGRLLDVELLDHVIIGRDGFVSLRERGIAFDRPPSGHERGGGPAVADGVRP